MEQNIYNFPKQTVPDSKKRQKKWQEACVKAGAEALTYYDYGLRQSFYNKRINYDLYNQKLDKQDIQRVCSLHNLDSISFPDSMRHVGMGNNKIDRLVGEEIRRGYDVNVSISAKDSSGVSAKENSKKNEIEEGIRGLLEEQSDDEELIKDKLEDLVNRMKYDWQDLREMVMSNLVDYEVRRQNIKNVFTDNFRDLLISGEEITAVEEVSGHPVVRKVDSDAIIALGSSYTGRIEDSDIIVEYNYKSPSAIVNDYYEYLSKRQVERLEEGHGLLVGNAIGYSFESRYGVSPSETGLFHPASDNHDAGSYFGYANTEGDIRVARVCWASKRKIGEVKWTDEDGYKHYKIVPEDYTPDKERGEDVRWFWVIEWWEGTQIGRDMYTKIRPIPFTGDSMVNLSQGNPPYIGTFASVGKEPAQGLMDKMKPLDYLYDIIYWKRNLEIATYYGNITAFNLSMIPNGWDPEKWMHYATQKKLMPLDPTNEIVKGAAEGKSAGVFNQLTATNVPAGDSDSITVFDNILQQIEVSLGKISGVSPQREGDTSPSESASGIEKNVVQSAHITEGWFNIHDDHRQRVLQRLLEVIKHCARKNPEKYKGVLDEVGISMSDDFSEYTEVEYDVHVNNSRRDDEITTIFRQTAHAAMQNSQIKPSDVMEAHMVDSPQAIARKLRDAEKRMDRKQQKEKQHEKELKDKEKEAKMMEIQREHTFELLKQKRQQEHDLRMKILDIQSKLTQERIKNAEDQKKTNKQIELEAIKTELEDQRSQVQQEIEQNKIDSSERLEQQKLKQQAQTPTKS